MSEGFVATGYEAVREAFDKAQAADPGGAQLCVYRNGKPVVDIWTGRDIANDRPYTADTLTVLMSCSKGAVAVLANMLAERGALDVEAPVAKYWPEFAQNGKDRITVAHCLTHTAGLPVFPKASGIQPKDFPDWDKCVNALAAAKPLWPAGEHGSYHAVTYGYLVGEVLRRITGKSVGTLLGDEIAKPLGLDLWIGLPQDKEARVAPHIPKPGPMPFRQLFTQMGVDVNDPVMIEILDGFDAITETVDFINTPAGHRAEIPAANGIGNARALARMYAACIGEVDGVRLLKPETVDCARRSRTRGLPQLPAMAKMPVSPGEGFGLGFALGNPVSPMLASGSFGHDGAGGRLGFAHPESGIAVGYACNSMLWDNLSPDPRWAFLRPLGEILRN